jgi:nucleoside-diphosphate-sugar epimerase
MQDKVLVTGLGGFTGGYLKRHLEKQGLKVVGLGREALQVENYHQCDLDDPLGLRKVLETECPKYVVHLAAIASPMHIPVSDFYQVNTVGTINLMDSIHGSGVEPKKILIASSANVYGMAEGFLSETTQLSPMNHYGASKAAMELLLAKYAGELPVVITRPFNYTGIGQSTNFLIPKIIEHYKKKKTVIELGNVDIERDIFGVEEVCAAYSMLLSTDSATGVYNISSGRAWSLKSILQHLDNLVGYQINVRVNPKFIRSHEAKMIVGDNTKLLEVQKTSPNFSLFDLLERMYDSS